MRGLFALGLFAFLCLAACGYGGWMEMGVGGYYGGPYGGYYYSTFDTACDCYVATAAAEPTPTPAEVEAEWGFSEPTAP